MSKPICWPLVHLNGTSQDSLCEQLQNAYHAIGAAIVKVKQAAPNRRDYYPLPDNWWDEAQAQHRKRLQILADLQDEIEAEIGLILDDAQHDWNAYASAKGGAK